MLSVKQPKSQRFVQQNICHKAMLTHWFPVVGIIDCLSLLEFKFVHL